MNGEEALQRLKANFHARAAFWKAQTNDPHNIVSTMIVVMSECEDTIEEALKNPPEMIETKEKL